MTTEKDDPKEYCLNEAKAYLVNIELILKNLKASLECNDDVHQQVGYLAIKAIHEFITTQCDKHVNANLNELYKDAKDLSTKTGDKPVHN